MVRAATFCIFLGSIQFQLDLVSCNLKLPVYDSLRNSLALDVLRAKPGHSAVVSTLLVRFSLCKLASVAVGDAKQELLSVLGYKSMENVKTCYTNVKEVLEILKTADLTCANKIYVNYTDDIKQDFITNSSLLYGVQVDKVGFNFPSTAQSFINRWIETATYKRIKEVVDKQDIDKTTTMLLVSAAHFRLTWEFPFDQSMTNGKKFHHHNKKISTLPMITKFDEFLYLDDDPNNLKMITCYLGAWGTSITFVVPNSAQGLPGILHKLHLNPDWLTKSKKSMKWKTMKIFLPRFKIKTHVDWTEFLKLISLKQIFNDSYSGLEEVLKSNSKTKNIWLGKAKQKVFIELDEMGVARVAMRPDPAPDPKYMQRVMMGPGINMLEFAVDRPFYFAISITLGSVSHDIFNGVYYGPESN